MTGNTTVRRMKLAAFAAAAQPGAANASALAVTGLKAWPLREPVSRRAYTVIEAETRAGITGWGECPLASAEGLAFARQAVIGQPATSFEVISRRLVVQPALQAAVTMALLDIVGRQAKAPIYQVLGGPTRNKARALATLTGASDSELAASMKRAREAGFRAMLVPVPAPASPNQGKAFVNATRGRLESLRSAAGDEVDFVLDGAAGLTPGDAASLAAACERFHLLWFDEPCRLSNTSTIRKIAAETVTPLGFGRRVHQAGVFQDLLREDNIDILRPGLGLNGLPQLRRMAALAETYYVAIAPYHDGGPIATAAALHLAASLPNFFIQQIPLPEAAEDRAMRASLAGQSVEKVADGYAALPDGPGLGITVNREALEKYKERAA